MALRAAPRSGPWREQPVTVATRRKAGMAMLPRWVVRNADTGAWLHALSGRRPKTFRRRAHAYAAAERLNRQEADRQREELAALGL